MAGGAKAQKRKSVENQSPVKKAKLENGAGSPQAKKPFNKNASPQKPGNKKFQGQKPKPFAGTKQQNIKPKTKQDKGAEQKATGEVVKRKRSAQFHKIKEVVHKTKGQSDPEIIKTLDEKIKTMQSRDGELTKSARRKIAVLKKLKAIAEGKIIEKSAAPKEQKSTSKGRRDRKKVAAAKNGDQKKVKKGESDDDDDEEEENDAEESSDEEAGAEAAEEDDDDDDGAEEGGDSDDEEDGDDDDDEEDESEDDQPAPKEKTTAVKKNKGTETTESQGKIKSDSAGKVPKDKKEKKSKPKLDAVNVKNLKNKEIIGKTQTRFVLFVGNIPYDVTTHDLKTHFSKVGEILHVRIPLEQKTNKPRGFAYVEVKDEETYQKCLSMHHSQLNGRRINVMYTQGGKKNSENKKKDIKVKNMKLHALRKQGLLAGSIKEKNKRAYRRKVRKAKYGGENKTEQ